MARTFLVSNRVAVPREGNPAGGLEVALRDTLKRHQGTWLGWSGTVSESGDFAIRTMEHDGLTLMVTDLSKDDYEEYYQGFANRVLWPILHYRLDLAEFSRRDLTGYMRVNRRLANELHKVLEPDDVVWVHDYHLLPFGKILRDLGHSNRIGFFLHVPMPPPEILAAIPNYDKLLPSLQAYDLVGFQTDGYAANFARFLAQEFGAPNQFGLRHSAGARGMRIGTFPVGIDTVQYHREAAVAAKTPYVSGVAETLAGALIIGVDRLDYSKGISLRLDAYESFLRSSEKWRGKVTFLQITPKSRSEIPEYAQMESELEATAGRVNGNFGDARWTPVRYVNRAHTRDELGGLYRLAKVGLVTPMRDGMNLVAKEYVAAQDESDPGVLVLSKFAGAACELSEALLVNPYDVEAVAATIEQALEMPLDERRARHKKLFEMLCRNDISTWGDKFLDELVKSPRRAGPRRMTPVIAHPLRAREVPEVPEPKPLGASRSREVSA